ncbi:tetratricopeptide repeat protein [Streptomyces griseoluteus]|uniref:tetratricopeptide repeat protein n=1 Tax=Streptomyces griseoluteus TaxID=29306 RepID=UPI00370276BB
MAAGHLQVGQLVMAAPSPGMRVMTLAAPMGLRHPQRPLRGRTALLDELRQQCGEGGDGQLHVLHGLSGSGKTAVALELVHALRARFGPYTWWIDGRQAALFESGLRAVARRLGIPDNLVEAGEVIDVLWLRLSQAERPWLLVVDGVSDPSVLDGPGHLAAGTGWIRPHSCPFGLVLITTHDGTKDVWGSAARLHSMPPLTEREAAQVLFDHAGPDAGSWSDAVRLARRLGSLPLALRMAGSYLAEVSAMPDAFRDAEMPAEFSAFVQALDEPVGHGLNPAPVIADMWRLALDMLDRRGFKYASAMLELLCSFADAPIPYALVLRPALLEGQPGFEKIDGGAIWQTLRALAALSLIEFCDAEGDDPSKAVSEAPVSVRVHPLIRDLGGSRRYLPLVAVLLERACSIEQIGKPEEPVTWGAWSTLAPHAVRLAEQEAVLGDASCGVQAAAAEAVEMAGRFLLARSLPRQAGAVFERVVEWRVRLGGPTAPETLTAQHNLAGALHDMGDLDRAEAVFRNVWQSHRTARGETFAHALTARHELGRVLHDMGRLSDAQEHLCAVLESQRQVKGAEHAHTLSARHELARVLHDLGRWAEARDHYGQVLQVRRRELGDNHPRTLTVLHNLACLAQDEGRLEVAVPQLRSVYSARVRALGLAHSQTLSTAYRLGCALRDTGDRVEAHSLLQQVYTDLASSLGDSHAHARRAAEALRSLTAASG